MRDQPQAVGEWKPILAGPLRDEAVRSIRAIAAAVRDLPGPLDRAAAADSSPSRRGDQHRTADSAAGTRSRTNGIESPGSSLMAGSAGLAVLFAYLAEAGIGRGNSAIASAYLERAMAAVAQTPMDQSLYGGFTGIAWAVAHLRSGDGDEESTGAIDRLIRQQVRRRPWRGPYDLVAGLVGLGVYALERLPAPVAAQSVAAVVDRLGEIAEPRSTGVTWYTSGEQIPSPAGGRGGQYNLGMAHGVPGVIAFLGQVCANSPAASGPSAPPTPLRGLTPGARRALAGAAAKARPLLEGAVAWLLAQNGDTDSAFPYCVGPRIKPVPARLAWCYGDLGIAFALLVAARGGARPEWEREALRAARRAAAQPFERSGVADCGLCHGAAGAGHLFNRLYQATGEAWLRVAAQVWFRRTLKMRRTGRGIAGYSAFRQGAFLTDPGILEGAGGIALALAAAVTPVAPDWDRLLLLSIPPRPAA